MAAGYLLVNSAGSRGSITRQKLSNYRRHCHVLVYSIRRFLMGALAGNLCNEHIPFAVPIYDRILVIFYTLYFASSQACVDYSGLAESHSASTRLLKTYTPAT
jgi:hypothetical protein